MQKIQLYIEGQRVDLFEDESVVLTQTIQNVKDVQKVFTDYSKTFTLPATKENNKIFKHYYNNSITNGFDGRGRVNATLELNYLKFRKGKIKLEGVDLRNNVPYTYKVRFTGNTVTLKDLLGEDKLGALSDLNSNTLVYNAANVKAKLEANPATSDIITPLITHTKQLFYEDGTHGEGSGNLWYESGTGTSHHHGVAWDDLKYAIRVDTIIQAIETNYGISFSNDFFNSSNTPYYNLFMWLHRKKGYVESPTATEVESLVNTWTATNVGQTVSLMSNTSTLYIGGTPSRYTKLDLKLRTTSGFSYSVSVQLNGNEIYNSGSVTGDLDITKDNIGTSQGNYNVIIQSAQNVTFSEVTWDVGYRLLAGLEAFNTYTSASFSHTNAFDFIITQQIPEIKCIDFLTGIFKMFNLTSYIDNDTDEVIVKTLDDFYSDGVSYDITEFVDRNKSSVNIALPFKEITFEHGDTKTFLASKHSQLFNNTWGKIEYTSGENLDGKIYKVKTPFSHMLYERLIDLDTDALTTVQYGWYVDDNQSPYYGKPLLFYPILQNTTSISFLDTTSSHSEVTQYNIPSNSVALSSSTSKYNINFNNEINEYTLDNTFTDTLFEAYHKDYISDVFDPTNRLTKVTAYLPLRILLNYTLADRFNISGTTYKINSIKTNMLTGKSDLELLNDIYTPPAPAIPPDTTPPTAPIVNTSSTIRGTTQIYFCWAASTDTGVGVKSYSVTQDSVLVQRVSATPYQDFYCVTITGLTSGTSYTFGITATDFNDNVSTTTNYTISTL
jgi:hypothetical protein